MRKHQGKLAEGSDFIFHEVVTMTPKTAKVLLKDNVCNRPISWRHVRWLTSQITEGKWRLNLQPIIMDSNDNLQNGQHRLLAIIEADKPADVVVAYGGDPQAFDTLDTGRSRTGADALAILFGLHGEQATATSTAVGLSVRYENGRLGHNDRIDPTDTIGWFEANQKLRTSVEYVLSFTRSNRPLSAAQMAFLHFQFLKRDVIMANNFTRRLMSGVGLAQGDVELAVRAILQRDRNRRIKMSSIDKVCLVIRAWNFVRKGKRAVNEQTLNRREKKIPVIR